MVKYPEIKTPLPGPLAAKLIEMDREFVSPSYTRVYPLVAQSGEGVWIKDPDGNTFLDFTAGIAVCATGHCHPAVVRAIKDQADLLLHMSGTDFYYTPQIMLAKTLALLMPMAGGGKVYFGNSGAEAVEAAFKLARWHTFRELNLAFFGAFSRPDHGRPVAHGQQNHTEKALQSYGAGNHAHPLLLLLQVPLQGRPFSPSLRG